MKYTTLGNTDIEVSKICLGTMTWGYQNTEVEGHEQIDYALSQGVNFIDTAEMYPVPGTPERHNATEIIIGNWFQKNNKRDKIVLATKIVGPNPGLKYIRPNLGFDPKQIDEALEGSLRRLQTDYIDLYQFHWPERKTNFFGKLGYDYDPNDPWVDNIHENLHHISKKIAEGKIRHIGISNETPWGMYRYLMEAHTHGLPKIVSVQNPYSLLTRMYEVGNAEISIREKCGLLAYSPLAFGILSGKYLNNQMPEGSRMQLFSKQLGRYNNDHCTLATEKYQHIAQQFDLSLTQLALGFVNTRPFLTSNIIGATTLDQLKENIGTIDVDITPEIMMEIETIHKIHTYPAP